MTDTEINCECARQLGWKGVEPIDGNGTIMAFDPQGTLRSKLPNFHGSVDASLQLVERAKKMGFCWSAGDSGDQIYFEFYREDQQPNGDIFHSDVCGGYSPTLSAAICAAFLMIQPPTETP